MQAVGDSVWQDSSRGKELAVIHRSPYIVAWTLSKGKLKSGESWQEVDLREVWEKIGLEGRLEEFLGRNTYDVNGVPKVLLCWSLSLTDEGNFEQSGMSKNFAG